MQIYNYTVLVFKKYKQGFLVASQFLESLFKVHIRINNNNNKIKQKVIVLKVTQTLNKYISNSVKQTP